LSTAAQGGLLNAHLLRYAPYEGNNPSSRNRPGICAFKSPQNFMIINQSCLKVYIMNERVISGIMSTLFLVNREYIFSTDLYRFYLR